MKLTIFLPCLAILRLTDAISKGCNCTHLHPLTKSLLELYQSNSSTIFKQVNIIIE